MAKGQMRGNREVKKPKKKKEAAVPATSTVVKNIPASFGASKKTPKK
jgi:hypothetical protein